MKCNWLAPLVLTNFLTACMATGPSMSGNPSGPSTKGIKSLYVSPGIMQYFLLPQRLQGPMARYAELDLVVRDSAGVPRNALLHLSMIEPSGVAFGPADTLLLQCGNHLSAVVPRILYAERQHAGQLTRLEVPLSPVQIKAYLQAPASYTLMVGRAGIARLVYQPDRKAMKCLSNFSAAAIR